MNWQHGSQQSFSVTNTLSSPLLLFSPVLVSNRMLSRSWLRSRLSLSPPPLFSNCCTGCFRSCCCFIFFSFCCFVVSCCVCAVAVAAATLEKNKAWKWKIKICVLLFDLVLFAVFFYFTRYPSACEWDVLVHLDDASAPTLKYTCEDWHFVSHPSLLHFLILTTVIYTHRSWDRAHRPVLNLNVCSHTPHLKQRIFWTVVPRSWKLQTNPVAASADPPPLTFVPWTPCTLSRRRNCARSAFRSILLLSNWRMTLCVIGLKLQMFYIDWDLVVCCLAGWSVVLLLLVASIVPPENFFGEENTRNFTLNLSLWW